MKKNLFLGALVLLSISASAQISVNQNGRVTVGDVSVKSGIGGAIDSSKVFKPDTTANINIAPKLVRSI